MPASVSMERQYQIRDQAGNVVWIGTAIINCDFLITATAAAIGQEAAVIVDSTTVLGRADNPGTSDAVYASLVGKAVVNASSVGFLGVADEPIAASAVGRVIGPGSITSVKCTSAAIAAGANVGGSASAGLCADITFGTNNSLGVCIVANSQQGSTGSYACGVLVCPIGA